MAGYDILTEIRKHLSDLNKEILNHPYIVAAETGKLDKRKISLFVANQAYIVYHDARSLAIMLSKARYSDELEFFRTVLEGDLKAISTLSELCNELSVDCWSFKDVRPAATCYTHYLAWLALYANPGESALALTVNLPVWGSNVRRLLNVFKNKYGLKELSFLELFAQDYRFLEELASPIIERYYETSKERYYLVAKMIQAYEKMFWDSIYV